MIPSIVAVVGALALAAVVGWLLNRRTGAVRPTDSRAAGEVDTSDLGLSDDGPTVVHFSAPWCLVLAAPSAARESAATQQLQQQQQQPATRHRSTARRLVSRSSTRADTSDSLPNGHTIKPTAESTPTAGHRLSAHPRRGIADAPAHRR